MTGPVPQVFSRGTVRDRGPPGVSIHWSCKQYARQGGGCQGSQCELSSALALPPHPAIRPYGIVRSEPTALTGRQQMHGHLGSLEAEFLREGSALRDSLKPRPHRPRRAIGSGSGVGPHHKAEGASKTSRQTPRDAAGIIAGGGGMMGNTTRTSKRHSAPSSVPILLISTGIVVWSIGPFHTPDLPGVLEGAPHAVAYAVLVWAALSLLMAGSTPRLRARWPRIVFAALLSAFLGVGLEIAQATVHRDAEVGDVVADLVGITAGVLAWLIADRRRQRRCRAP